ncbi:D-alanyl-lipoteichoic acid biosynthesis protein DltD [Leptothoe sp. PORK10 BA2]|uniref:D-alanyl-lipoteichoic acid biosynthesis protein DltD n=1 Tax=Leptothoe sp. PORK10 BA2 TaxID=3110254 RepID=UPI002B20D49C|nr:D-alanyl-lipoteichoic acid biosynthesis protein DltD [Leptothoe sp. PORK10 BA2]MEA5465825.1 D-alanyl-lipoteichoic acid biosynthesis protein DltD [Leptothoe sp. PORK10 BA2]
MLLVLSFWLSQGSKQGVGSALAVKAWPMRGPAAALQSGFNQAERAKELAKTATSADQWDGVATAWTDAIAALQTIPAQSPERFFVQRKQQEYLTQLAAAQQRALQLSGPDVFPSLGSAVLDDQLRLYLSYLAAMGPPEILIVGSSRVLQGLNPQFLETTLGDQGTPARVFNLGVNGATAQVVDFMLQQLLTPEQLPKLVIWGDGSRAFNSGRSDATFARILGSPGYQAIVATEKPQFTEQEEPRRTPRPPSAINAYGFLPVTEAFDPAVYYQTSPRVNGRYDAFYSQFSLAGTQEGALRSLVAYLKSHNVDLIYVNLPLSGDYLDDYRLPLEQRFQQFLQAQSQRQGFGVIDLLSQWMGQNTFFADPSHLNQTGAAALGQQLARHPLVREKLQD